MLSILQRTGPIFRAGILIAALSPATYASAQTAPEEGVYCGEKYKFYGREGYTYTELMLCLAISNGTGSVWFETSETQYKRWGLWHYAGNGGATALWNASVGLTRRGVQLGRHEFIDVIQDERFHSAQSRPLPVTCGPLEVDFKFHMLGPKWNDEKYEIDPRVRKFDLHLPCRSPTPDPVP